MPAIESEPGEDVHRTGFGSVLSLHKTTSELLLKHESVMVANPPVSVTWPAQFPPELKLKLPVGLHAVMVVGGGGGAE